MSVAPVAGVVLLHGHGRRGASLGRMSRAIATRGFATVVPAYPYRRTLPDILDALTPRIAAFANETGGPIHLVTHSLGSLVARALLVRGEVTIGRVVMLGPPNRGSEWADLLFRLRLDRAILGRSAPWLRTMRVLGDEAMLGNHGHDIGIIAGDRALDPIFPRLLLPRPNDGKVTVAATMLDGAEHLVLPVSHTLMVYDLEVIRRTIAFLENGRFRQVTLDDGIAP